MGLVTLVLGEAGRWGHAEQGSLLGAEHHAGGHEWGLESGAAGEKSLSERRGEHFSFSK